MSSEFNQQTSNQLISGMKNLNVNHDMSPLTQIRNLGQFSNLNYDESQFDSTEEDDQPLSYHTNLISGTRPPSSNNQNRPAHCLKPTFPAFTNIPPDMESVQHLYEAYQTKVYYQGYLKLKNDLTLDGQAFQNGDWIEYYCELTGPALALWEIREEETMPHYIQITDANLVEIGSETFGLNTSGANRYLIEPASHLTDWIISIRLAAYEYTKIQESFTYRLLNRSADLLQQQKTKQEGELQVCLAGSSQWQKYWVSISDNKKRFGTKRVGKIKFYEARKSKSSVMSLTDIVKVYAIYPESPDGIEGCQLFKLEGLVEGKESRIYLMASSNREMLRWLVQIMDLFKLYGRPGELIKDRLEMDSLEFGETVKSRLFLDLVDLVGQVDVQAGSAEWRSRLNTILLGKIKRKSVGGLLGGQSAVGSQYTIGSQNGGLVGSQQMIGSQPAVGSQATIGSQPAIGSQVTIGSQPAVGSQATVGSQHRAKPSVRKIYASDDDEEEDEEEGESDDESDDEPLERKTTDQDESDRDEPKPRVQHRPKPKVSRTQVSLSGSDESDDESEEEDDDDDEENSYSGSDDDIPIQQQWRQQQEWDGFNNPALIQEGYDEYDGPIIPHLGDHFATQNSLLDTYRPSGPSAHDQEDYARATGQPLIQVNQKPGAPRAGLVGMISQIEEEKKNKDSNKRFEMERLREQERYAMEQRNQMMHNSMMGSSMMNPMMYAGMNSAPMMNPMPMMMNPSMMYPNMMGNPSMMSMGTPSMMSMGNPAMSMGTPGMLANPALLSNPSLMSMPMMPPMMDPRMSMMMPPSFGQYPMWQQQAGFNNRMNNNIPEDDDEDDDVPLGAKSK